MLTEGTFSIYSGKVATGKLRRVDLLGLKNEGVVWQFIQNAIAVLKGIRLKLQTEWYLLIVLLKLLIIAVIMWNRYVVRNLMRYGRGGGGGILVAAVLSQFTTNNENSNMAKWRVEGPFRDPADGALIAKRVRRQ